MFHFVNIKILKHEGIACCCFAACPTKCAKRCNNVFKSIVVLIKPLVSRYFFSFLDGSKLDVYL